ncbi:cytochrome c [Azorhizobium sp. AG788]|uniref:cytochrome c n=1 Tax=Azorhizobium sp. AG788 TaxID=2183897 RepID=UPI003138675D
MLRFLLAAALIGATSVPASLSAAPFALTSVSVDLPMGDRMFPDGKGADAVTNNCLACHSAGMVLNQPKLSEATWASIVAKMMNAYKAPVDPADVSAIVGYLASMKVGPE